MSNVHEAVDITQVMMAAATLLAEDPMFKVSEANIRGNTYRVFANAPESMVGVFQFGASHGDKPFIHYQDEVYSFRETWEKAQKFADGLAQRYGIKKGDRVAIAMRNYPEFCFAYMGVIAMGAVVVPLNAWWKTEELAYALNDCGAKTAIVDGKRLSLLQPVQEQLNLTLVLARDEADGANVTFEELINLGKAQIPVVDLNPEDDFAIYYTSGSTGTPKGVVLTHRGCLTTLFSWAFIASAIKKARGGVSLFGDDPGILLAVPLFHVTGTHSIFLMSMLIGRRVAMMYRWDAVEAANLIRRFSLTNFVGVPSQSFELVEAAGERGLPSLIDIGSGGAKRPPDHVRILKQRFQHANPSSGYGLTETNAIGCVGSLDDYQKRPESTGRAVPPCCDIKVVGENGDCGVNEVGELWIRSAANFREYLNRPADTAKALTHDGWFQTGDLGKIDEEGFVYIVDRIKELIIRGGENISCLEVEAKAYEHPDVLEATVFSVPDDVLGERVGLVYFPKAGSEVSPHDVRDFIGSRLAAFKVPERIWVSPSPLPRLGTAKFDKISIRKMALQQPPEWAA